MNRPRHKGDMRDVSGCHVALRDFANLHRACPSGEYFVCVHGCLLDKLDSPILYIVYTYPLPIPYTCKILQIIQHRFFV